MQIDDVRNSEYIEEAEVKRFSMEQRSQLFRESNVIVTNEDVFFRFQAADGGTGGLDGLKKLNRSHDITDDDHLGTGEDNAYNNTGGKNSNAHLTHTGISADKKKKKLSM